MVPRAFAMVTAAFVTVGLYFSIWTHGNRVAIDAMREIAAERGTALPPSAAAQPPNNWPTVTIFVALSLFWTAMAAHGPDRGSKK